MFYFICLAFISLECITYHSVSWLMLCLCFWLLSNLCSVPLVSFYVLHHCLLQQLHGVLLHVNIQTSTSFYRFASFRVFWWYHSTRNYEPFILSNKGTRYLFSEVWLRNSSVLFLLLLSLCPFGRGSCRSRRFHLLELVSLFLRLNVDVNVADGRYILTRRVQSLLARGFWGEGWGWENIVLYAVVMFRLRGVVFLGLENKILTDKFAFNKTLLVLQQPSISISSSAYNILPPYLRILNSDWSKCINCYSVIADSSDNMSSCFISHLTKKIYTIIAMVKISIKEGRRSLQCHHFLQ